MSEQLRLVPWFDRNPSIIYKHYTGEKAVHAATERWTYTVPKNRKAFLELAVCRIMRLTASTTDPQEKVTDYIAYKPKDQNQSYLVDVEFIDAKVNAFRGDSIAQSMILFEGDNLKGYTADLNSNGTCDHMVIVKLTEFDVFPIEAPPFQIEMPKVDIQEPTIKSMVEQIVEGIRKVLG